jgi:hypothetical protein
MEWKHSSLPRTKKFKGVPSASKVMLTLSWDFNGPILKHYEDCGQMVNSTQYCSMLEDEMKPAIHSKCTDLLTNRVVLHHDKAWPHMAAVTTETN